eukprot:g27650.t1
MDKVENATGSDVIWNRTSRFLQEVAEDPDESAEPSAKGRALYSRRRRGNQDLPPRARYINKILIYLNQEMDLLWNYNTIVDRKRWGVGNTITSSPYGPHVTITIRVKADEKKFDNKYAVQLQADYFSLVDNINDASQKISDLRTRLWKMNDYADQFIALPSGPHFPPSGILLEDFLDVTRFVIKWPSTQIGPQLIAYLRSLPDSTVQEYMDEAKKIRCWRLLCCIVMDSRPAKAAAASGGASVLLEESHLHQAYKEVTRGGRQHLQGIYTPKGRIPENGQEAEEQENLAKMAEQYKAKKKELKKKAKGLNKSDVEFEDSCCNSPMVDERVQRKAAKILSKASEVEKSQYKAIFSYFDADEDFLRKLAQRMTDLGYATSVEAASNLLYFAGVRDVDRTGVTNVSKDPVRPSMHEDVIARHTPHWRRITYEDFVTMMPKLQAFRKLMEKDFMLHFQEKDDGTGHITTQHFKELLLQLAGPDVIDETQMADIIKKADPTREGRVTFESMILALFGSRPLLPYQPPQRHKSFMDLVLDTLGQLCGTSSPPSKTQQQQRYVSDVAPPLPPSR